MNFFNSNFLFASLVWGSVGMGYWIYGKKQQTMACMIGGVLMMAASYFAPSAFIMSLICVLLMVVVFTLAKQGY